MSDSDDSSDRDEETGNGSENDREYDDPADDPEEAPTEPRDSEEGQQQAAESEEGEIDAGAEPEDRDEHPDADAGDADTHGGVEPVGQRETAPQSDFTARQVGIGFAVLAVGLLVVFALPLLVA